MFRSMLRHSQVPAVTTFLVLGFVAAAPATGALPGLAAADSDNGKLFHGVAVQWVWTVRGDATLEDGNHLDTGHLQVTAECLTGDDCDAEFTFTGALGTATCGRSGGALTGYMSLYAGASFECSSLSIMVATVAGAAACEAGIAAGGIQMGTHRLGGAGAAAGACVDG